MNATAILATNVTTYKKDAKLHVSSAHKKAAVQRLFFLLVNMTKSSFANNHKVGNGTSDSNNKECE